MRTGENIYKRQDGRWEGRYKNGYKPDGTVKYSSLYAKTYSEVKTKLETAKRAEKPPQKNMNVKLCDVALEWLEMAKIEVKESTYALYRRNVESHILPHIGGLKLSQITSQCLTNFANDLLAHGRCDGKGGLSANTVQDICTLTGSILEYAKREYKVNVSLEPPTVKVPEKEMRVLSLDEQRKLEIYLFSSLDLIAIGCLLSLYVGLRIGELSALKLSDFDFSNGTLRITKTLQRVKNFDPKIKTKTKIIIDSPKSKKSVRTLPVPGFLLEIIKKRYNLVIPNAYFLTGKTSRYKEPRRVEYQFKKITDRCGLKEVNFHALRHTFATRLTEHGTDVKTLSELMGHANIKTTLKYMHSSEQQKRAVMNCFASPLSRQHFGICNKEFPENKPVIAI